MQLYTEQEEIKLSVLTWNCAGNAPPSPAEFLGNHILFQNEANREQEAYPDIFVIGL